MDAGLSEVVDAWPRLSSAVRDAVLVLVIALRCSGGTELLDVDLNEINEEEEVHS